MELTVRNTGIDQLMATLNEQQARKLDLVVNHEDLRATEGGRLEIKGQKVQFSAAGLTDPNGLYLPTDIFQGQVAKAFEIDTRYLRKMAKKRPDIWAANVNGWLKGHVDPLAMTEPYADPDHRSFLFRAFAGEDGNMARALLSDRFGIIDHLDVLTAVVSGVNQAADDLGHDWQGGPLVTVAGADLTDSRMFVRFVSPVVAVGAAGLLQHYRDPFRDGSEVRVGSGGWNIDQARAAAAREGQGYEPGKEPIVWAGFEVGNSEVGAGSAYVAPRAQIEICGNGLKLDVNMFKAVHLGGKQERGRVNWSADTMQKRLAVITAEARDSVKLFLSPEFWQEEIAKLERLAGKPVADPRPVLEEKSLGFSEAERDGIFRHFMLGGAPTAGGVMNAVTSFAQTVADADRASELETVATKVLELA